MRRLEREIKEVESGHTRAARRGLAARARGRDQQSQCAARWRTHAHQALSRHARQSRAQPEDAARGHAPVAAARGSRRQGRARYGDRPHERHHRTPDEARGRQRRRVAGPGAGGRRARSSRELRAALLKVYGNKDLLFEIGDRRRRAVHRRSRRSHRAARQPARQRLQVVRSRACASRSAVDADGRLARRVAARSSKTTARASPRPIARACWSAAGAPTRPRPGHGLGLAMVHDTVALYGGIAAHRRSTLGGARFELELPGGDSCSRASELTGLP